MILDENAFKEFLISNGLITKSDCSRAETAAHERSMSLSDFLVSEGRLSETDLKRAQAFVLGVPFIDLTKETIAPEILYLIPEPIARTHNIIAYAKSPKEVQVAMFDIEDLATIEFIKKKLEVKISPRLTDSASIKHALLLYKKSLKAEFDDIIAKESASLNTIADVSGDGNQSEKDLKEMAEDLPIIKIVDTLISHAIIQGASDIHIEPGEESLVARYRIDGILHDAMTLPKETSAGIIARIKVLSSLKLDEKRLPQDGRFKITSEDGGKVSFRVSTIPTYFGEKVVIRVLKENAKGFTLEKLGFHGVALDRIHESMRQRTGILLAAGPTGSGKTTTLYTMLDILNTPEVNISTIEDPIEYQMPRINQTQVKSEIGMTFASGLRALLRQDPDICMVGEIRDGETAGIAVNAALTGHLVLSTIHTNSAAGAIPRLTDMGVLPFLLVSTIKNIIAQRLVRRLTDEKEQYFMSEAEKKSLSKVIDFDRMLRLLKEEKVIPDDATWETIPVYRPKQGISEELAYKGRIGIHEVLRISPAIKELIGKGASADQIETQAKEEGMMTMIEDGMYYVVLGLTTTEEVLRVVSE